MQLPRCRNLLTLLLVLLLYKHFFCFINTIHAFKSLQHMKVTHEKHMNVWLTTIFPKFCFINLRTCTLAYLLFL